MKFWPQIIPHRDLEHLELLELLLWNSIWNWNKHHYMLWFGIFTYYILLLGVKRSWVQVSSLGPREPLITLVFQRFSIFNFLKNMPNDHMRGTSGIKIAFFRIKKTVSLKVKTNSLFSLLMTKVQQKFIKFR